MLRYLTGKIDGTATAIATATAPKMSQDAFTYTETPVRATKARTVRMWSCDVCKETFPDYDEACRHEDQCRIEKEVLVQQQQVVVVTQSNASRAAIHIDSKVEHTPTKSESAVQEWRCDVCQKQFSDYDKACQHEKYCQQRKVEAKEPPKPVHPFFAKENRKQSATEAIISIDSSPEPLQQTSRKRNMPKQQSEPAKRTRPALKPEPPTAVPKTQAPKKNQAAPLASIFTGAAATQILAEHRAAEFAAKRRVEAERERERQRRRQANAQEKLKASTLKSVESSKPIISKLRHPPAVRFPVPSHVGAVEPSDLMLADSSTSRADRSVLTKAQECLGKTPRHAGSEKLEQPNDCSGVLPSDDKPFVEMDPLQVALANLLIPPEEAADGTLAWCDKYTIQKVPEDVCGKGNRETAKELVSFVDEWKVERQRAHERRAEKQRALLKSKKKNGRKYRDADDLWNETDDEDGGLCCVCLLTGPTGSGKTSLVHAIARQSNCVVLEINTTERRGGQALKNAIEEATQSDSSLDMLKKNQITFNADPFEDSDDEIEATTKGSSVVIILIDEVDIMYEDEGDAGFWGALSSLTKKAKCPIFLTANVVPDALLSSSIRYRHLETFLPKPKECVTKMRQIIKSEGFSLIDNFAYPSVTDKQLSFIAQLCKCDLRRVINELQLYASGPSVMKTDGDATAESSTPEITYDSRADFATPVITDISPKQVSPHDLSLLTIRGKNFTSLRASGRDTFVQVSIGNQLCPAVRILNDSTILAVLPSYLPPRGVDDFGVIEKTGQESRTSRFAPLSIHFHCAFGLISTLDATTSTTELCDGTSSISLGRRWNVEYAFPPPRHGILDYVRSRTTGNDGESGEEELECEANTAPGLHSYTITNSTSKGEDVRKEAALILEEGVRDWNASHSERIECDVVCARACAPDNEQCLRKLEVLSSQAHLASDAAMLEDALECGGLPFLVGEVPGFGASLVNDVAGNRSHSEGSEKRLFRDANARPPSFERLFSLGWNEDGYFFGNSDTYVTNPCDGRERKLLAFGESLERGLARPLTTVLPALDPLQDEDCHDTGGSESTLSDSIKLHKAPRRATEEDQFIRPPCASSILSLPSHLRRHLRNAGFNPIGCLDLARLPTAIHEKAYQHAKLLCDMVKDDPDASSNRVIYSVKRVTEISAAPFHDRIDRIVFLDYLPFLRYMAVHERAAEHAFQQVCASDPESAAIMSGRRRTTRRGGKPLERRHHFATMGSCKENSLANAIGCELADDLLHYSN